MKNLPITNPLTEERPDHETELPHPPQRADQTLSQDTISNLFHDRDQIRGEKTRPNRPQKSPTEASPENTNSFAKDEEQKKPKSPALPKEEDNLKEESDKPQDTSVRGQEELIRLQDELEKTQKRLSENQHYGRQNAQRLKMTAKLVKELEEGGSLNEEEAARLLESLETSFDKETDPGFRSVAFNPFDPILSIANKELDNIRRYTDDTSLDDKVRAFDYFLLAGSVEDQNKALEELISLKDSPLSLAKKMLSIGQQYQASYQEMKTAGSLQELLEKKDKTLLDLRKNLDKLTKKLAHYEDYDKPRYRLDEMGETQEKPSADIISSLFDDRDRIRLR